MSKPIFIIRIPHIEVERDRARVIEQTIKISEKLDDYHVLPVMESSISEIKFECFNAPHTEMEFEELKQRVIKMLE